MAHHARRREDLLLVHAVGQRGAARCRRRRGPRRSASARRDRAAARRSHACTASRKSRSRPLRSAASRRRVARRAAEQQQRGERGQHALRGGAAQLVERHPFGRQLVQQRGARRACARRRVRRGGPRPPNRCVPRPRAGDTLLVRGRPAPSGGFTCEDAAPMAERPRRTTQRPRAPRGAARRGERGLRPSRLPRRFARGDRAVAGVSKALIYEHFASKRELHAELVEAHASEIFRRLQASAADVGATRGGAAARRHRRVPVVRRGEPRRLARAVPRRVRPRGHRGDRPRARPGGRRDRRADGRDRRPGRPEGHAPSSARSGSRCTRSCWPARSRCSRTGGPTIPASRARASSTARWSSAGSGLDRVSQGEVVRRGRPRR